MVAPVSEGAFIDQRYHLGRVIRESGVAVVYEAKHRNGAEAWIKLPRTPDHAAALLAETRIANALGKNAVNLRDDGVTEDGLPYLVLEPVTGQRLDHWRQSSGGRAPPDEAMGLGDELCQAIGTMHAAGFAVGLLRADAIIVPPKGGMCLLELEHARPATPEAIKEDVIRVGRVLYEMLSGLPCLAQANPLHDAAPELPRAMTMTVDDAARGRYATIEELRSALRASMPDWLGPRKPMPSVTPDVLDTAGRPVSADFEGIVLPRPSRPLFDPRDLVDSTRNVDVLEQAREELVSRPSLAERPTVPGRPSDVSPVAAFAQLDPPSKPPLSQRRSLAFPIAGAVFALALVAGVVGIVRFASSDDPPITPPEPVAKAATSAVMVAPTAEPLTTGVLPVVTTTSAVPAEEVIEVDDVKPVIEDASTPATAAAVPEDLAEDETSFHFEGDLSPRLVLVDGFMMGTTTKQVRVKCGTHKVKIGGKGAELSLDLPCGGVQTLTIQSNGKWSAE